MLISKRSYADHGSPEQKRVEALLGTNPSFNMLPNLKQIEAKEFWHHVSICGWPRVTIHVNKCKYPIEDESGDVRPSWASPVVTLVDHGHMIGGGFAVAHIYSGKGEGSQHYFTWGVCDHEFRGKTIGRCLNLYTCTKCGKSYEVDSSD